ncbi:YxeA family protein [Ornithinibacillus bavariensis]|uniref:YxeA family protein n=1 Tax=Ornithinibacillus bavariensis TaxID=545502 RepID=A0A919XBM3_9BACI|nr:YxeA family protein [Ornithinibacillus bavariensis]GIO27952.1 hypothetical protein J43TS3_25630 [Ornithinibacillus bavariensis]HAM81098.1 hypothetical protein [Ornithinibacillus sp.]
MKKVLLRAIVVIIILTGVYFVFKEDLDRFNPLYEKEYVYVEVNEPSKPDNGRFKYNLTGYTEDGQKRKVMFTSSTDLEQGIYLKVLAKGKYTESWEFINEEDLPVDAKW